MRFLLFTLFAFAAMAVNAANYYIDYAGGADASAGTATGTAWKHCPGMASFAGSYGHVAGDRFVFKGGVTWPSNSLPLTVAYSGTGTNTMDTYGGLDRTWFTGAAWTHPLFLDATGMILDNRSNLCVDAIHFTNSAKHFATEAGLNAYDVGGALTIQNCLFQVNGAYGFKGGISDPAGPWRFLTNSFKECANAAIMGIGDLPDNPDATVYLMEIAHNSINGTSANDWGSHADGFQFFAANLGFNGNINYAFRDVYLHHNKFFGDYLTGATAFLWLPRMSNVWIHNNLFAFDNSNNLGSFMLNAPIYGGNCHTVRIFNNTFAGDANINYAEGFQWCIWFASDGGGATVTNLYVYNNIFSNHRNILALSAADTVRHGGEILLNHNVFIQPRQYFYYVGAFSSGVWDDYRSGEWDASGILTTDVNFVRLPNGVTDYPDWRIHDYSPAAFAGTNLSAWITTTDFAGAARPATGPWSAGAYNAVESLSVPAISGPGHVFSWSSGRRL